jgi:DNA/RNA endonuclease YhcR with UshA esterase domain
MKLIISLFAAVAPFVIGLPSLRGQEASTTQPSVIDVTDTAAVVAAMDRDVVVEGIVDRAEWSRSGKVMNIGFKGAENGLLAVVFERRRAQLDQQYAGDLARALSGAKVRLKGTIKPYGGRVESMKGRPQIIIDDGHQITILEKAPATQPSSTLLPSGEQEKSEKPRG